MILSDELVSPTKLLFDALGIALGAGTLWLAWVAYKKGIREYLMNNRIKRAEFLESLIKMSNNEALYPAKQILEDFVWPDNISLTGIDLTKYNNLPCVKIQRTLRDHKLKDVTDKDELMIRKSFGELLDFFTKLSYYLENRLITSKELGYFKYYIEKINYNRLRIISEKDLSSVVNFLALEGVDVPPGDLKRIADSVNEANRKMDEASWKKIKESINQLADITARKAFRNLYYAAQRENERKKGIKGFIDTYFYAEDYERLFNALKNP
jgi:hypothetical protein